MLLLADLLTGFEESLLRDSTLAVALRFIFFIKSISIDLNIYSNFEISEIGGCIKPGAGSKFSLKFGLQLVVWLQKQLMFKFAASSEQLISYYSETIIIRTQDKRQDMHF